MAKRKYTKKSKEVAEQIPKVSKTPVAKPEKVKYELCARYKIIDEDGDKIKIENKSEGESLEELLKNFDWPKGMTKLVKVTVKKDGSEVCEAVALAPHIARLIFENQDVLLLKKKFGL